GWRITDWLEGLGAGWPVSIGFMVHPALTITMDGSGWLIASDQEPLVRITSTGPLAVAIGCAPVSLRFGTQTSAQRLVAVGTLTSGQQQVWEIDVVARC
ncbi:MAG: hypothetical protein SF002_14170, partial [Alphaproteobacteria bacterium]|nr:hypothetical protein [Alphaproteobacteria bacterium]